MLSFFFGIIAATRAEINILEDILGSIPLPRCGFHRRFCSDGRVAFSAASQDFPNREEIMNRRVTSVKNFQSFRMENRIELRDVSRCELSVPRPDPFRIPRFAEASSDSFPFVLKMAEARSWDSR